MERQAAVKSGKKRQLIASPTGTVSLAAAKKRPTRTPEPRTPPPTTTSAKTSNPGRSTATHQMQPSHHPMQPGATAGGDLLLTGQENEPPARLQTPLPGLSSSTLDKLASASLGATKYYSLPANLKPKRQALSRVSPNVRSPSEEAASIGLKSGSKAPRKVQKARTKTAADAALIPAKQGMAALLLDPSLVFTEDETASNQLDATPQPTAIQSEPPPLDGDDLGIVLKSLSSADLKKALSMKDDLVKLFSWIQDKGLLKVEMLGYFSEKMTIVSLDYSASFAMKAHAELPFLRHCTSEMNDMTQLTRPLFRLPALAQSLAYLDCTGVPLSDDALRYLLRLTRLQGLGLSGTAVTERGLRYLDKHATQLQSSLRILKLCDLPLSDAALPYMTKYTALEVLDLLGTQITLEGAAQLIEYECDGPAAGDQKQAEDALQACRCRLRVKLPRLKSLRLPESAYAACLSLHSAHQLMPAKSLRLIDGTLPLPVSLSGAPTDPCLLEGLPLSHLRKLAALYHIGEEGSNDGQGKASLLLRMKRALIMHKKVELLWSLM